MGQGYQKAALQVKHSRGFLGASGKLMLYLQGASAMLTSRPQVPGRILRRVAHTVALELAPAHVCIALWSRSIVRFTPLPLRPWVQGSERLPGVEHSVQIAVKVQK